MSGSSPGSGVSSNRAGSTYSRRSRTARASAARRSQPGPVPGGVLGGDEHHDRRRLLAVDGRQLLGQVLAPQVDLLIGVVEAAHPPRLQRLGDLLDVVPLRAGERQRHIPPPPRPCARVRAAVRSLS